MQNTQSKTSTASTDSIISEEEFKKRNEFYELGMKAGRRITEKEYQSLVSKRWDNWFGHENNYYHKSMETMKLEGIYYITMPIILIFILIALLVMVTFK